MNQTNSLGIGAHWEKYDAWRVGDTKLDWFGPQPGQGTYMGSTAFGTPLAWTTDNQAKSGYHPLNKYSHIIQYDFNSLQLTSIDLIAYELIACDIVIHCAFLQVGRR